MGERPEKCPVCGDLALEDAGPDNNDEGFCYCSSCGWTEGDELPTRMQQLTERDLML